MFPIKELVKPSYCQLNHLSVWVSERWYNIIIKHEPSRSVKGFFLDTSFLNCSFSSSQGFHVYANSWNGFWIDLGRNFEGSFLSFTPRLVTLPLGLVLHIDFANMCVFQTLLGTLYIYLTRGAKKVASDPGIGSAISGLSCEATVHPGKSPWSPKLSDWRECMIWCSGTINAKWDKVTMIEKTCGGTRARRQIPMDGRLWAPCWLPKLPMESNDCFKEGILCWVKQGWLWPRH